MIELSVPELFPANRRKIAEVLIRAEGPVDMKKDLSTFLLARVLSSFVLLSEAEEPSRPKAEAPKYKFLASGITGHVPLIGCESYGKY